jgi:DNA-binding MarR family transcriptional regulator
MASGSTSPSILCCATCKRLDQPSISSLADAMGLDRSTLGRNLRVLEGAGLVKMVEGDDLRNRLVCSPRQANSAWQGRLAGLGSCTAETDR